MNDMSSIIVPKSDQINADDLIAGPRTITITNVDIRPGTEQPVSIYFEGDEGKPWRPCKSMSRVLVAAWGPDAKAYIGRSVTLYRDPKVKWGGMEVGGIRVSHLSDIDRDMVMALTATKGKRAPYTVKVLQSAPAPKPNLPTDNRAKAEAWLARYEADAKAATTKEELQAVHDKAAKALPKLKAEHPDLYERAMLTYPAPAEEDPFEGPADEQRGEAPTLDEAKAAIGRATTVIDVNALVQSYEGQLSDDDLDAVRSAATDRIAELKKPRAS